MGGDGNCSITETSKAVESGSQDEKMAVIKARGSLERMMCGGTVIPSDFVIFSIMLPSLYLVSDDSVNENQNIPSALAASAGCTVDSPNIFKDQLHKHGL